MHIDRVAFVISSVLILLGIAMSYLFSSRWLLVAAIVGINMVQAEFTGVCPVTMTLRKLGFKSDSGTR